MMIFGGVTFMQLKKKTCFFGALSFLNRKNIDLQNLKIRMVKILFDFVSRRLNFFEKTLVCFIIFSFLTDTSKPENLMLDFFT